MSERFSGVLCAVKSCNASKRSHPHRKFFAFPSDKILFDAWREKCGLTKTNLRRRLKVCEIHFREEFIGKRRLTKNSFPEYYLNDPNLQNEDEIPNNNDISCSQTLNDTITTPVETGYSELSEVIAPSQNAIKCYQTNCTEKFAKMMKYYKDEIKFLMGEITKLQKEKLKNIKNNTLQNLSSAAKEFGKMILNDTTRVWPCEQCMENIQVAIQLKQHSEKSDDKIESEVEKTIGVPISNSESDDNKNSDVHIESASLSVDHFEDSSRDIDAAVPFKSQNDEEDEPQIGRSMDSAPEKYECEKCNEKLDSYKQLIYHMRFHKDLNIYECERCGKEFHHGSKYRKHARIYKSDKPSICKICNKGFKCLSNLKQHELTHKIEKIHKCPYCSKWFCHKKGLNQHLVCHKEKPIKCSKCDKKFPYNSHLRIHNELVHEPKVNGSSETNRAIRNTLPKQCACEKCGKLFATEISLKFHIKCVHNRERPFQCSYCSKSFSISTSLKCHMQHHINSKNTKIDPKVIESYMKYKCDECDKAFTTPHFLRNHKIIHSGAKEHVCSYCGKGFAFKWYLQRHVRLLHDTTHPKNIVCSICRKVSANIWALQSHMLSHTGETPFHCKYCVLKFVYKKSLRIHMRNKHKSKMFS